MRLVAAAAFRVEPKSFPFERFQPLRVRDAMPEDMACHLPAAHFRIDDDGFHPVAFADAEFGRYDPHLAADPLPVEEPFHLGAGQIDQHAVVAADPLDERSGQPVPPPFEEIRRLLAGRSDAPFEAVGADGVERTEQSVEKRGDSRRGKNSLYNILIYSEL